MSPASARCCNLCTGTPGQGSAAAAAAAAAGRASSAAAAASSAGRHLSLRPFQHRLISCLLLDVAVLTIWL